MAGFPHSDILGSTPVYRLPEAYRRFPRPSSAPDAKASTMRSYTLTPPDPGWCFVCAKIFTLRFFDSKKITLHTSLDGWCLMLASTIRFSNHYQTPPPTAAEPAVVGVGLVTCETTFVVPGPNSVPVLSRPSLPRSHGTNRTTTRRMSERYVMFHP